MNESLLGLAGFVYTTEHFRGGKLLQARRHCNLIPQVGINHVAGLIRGSTSLISNWYVGLFEGNYVPSSSTTSADLPGNAIEFVGYDEVTRPAWTHVYDDTSVISNTASRAVFTVNEAKTVYGGFIVSSSAKGGNTGVLLSIARFSTADSLEIGDEYRIAAGLTIVPTSIL